MEIDRSNPNQTPAVRNGINRYNFLGKETQVATGYIDLQARFYDPLIGRFMQVDPETEGQDGFSPYHYSFNNPIRFSDPDGRWPWDGLVARFKQWYNTPLTKDQQQISRAASISNSPAKTQGENLENSLILGLSHAVSGTSIGSFRRPANMYKQNFKTRGNPSSKTTSPVELSIDKPQGTYSHAESQEPLPRKPNGEPAPDMEASGAHTQLSAKAGRKGTYNQARQFDANGDVVKDIDFTDHGRPTLHPNPHQHKYLPNLTGGTPQRSPSAEPLKND